MHRGVCTKFKHRRGVLPSKTHRAFLDTTQFGLFSLSDTQDFFFFGGGVGDTLSHVNNNGRVG